VTTEIDICNKAILRCGGNMISSSGNVVSTLTDDSLEKKLCKLNYALIRDTVTEDRVWSFALARVILDVPEVVPPVFGFAQMFPLPTDCLSVWRVSYESFNDDYAEYESGVQGDWLVEGGFILANAEKINVQYIRRMDQPGDIDLFTPQFIDSFSLRLAAEICVPLTENSGLFSALAQEYEVRKQNAYAVNGSQSKHESFRSTQLTRVR